MNAKYVKYILNPDLCYLDPRFEYKKKEKKGSNITDMILPVVVE